MLRRQVGKLLLVLAQAWFVTNVVEFGNGENNRCETKPGLPKEKKKSSHSTIASHLCKQKFKKTRFKDVSRWLLLAKGTSPGSLPNPPGTVRPVARPGVQRRTVAAPPSTRAWGVSVGWVEWWIRMALNG